MPGVGHSERGRDFAAPVAALAPQRIATKTRWLHGAEGTYARLPRLRARTLVAGRVKDVTSPRRTPGCFCGARGRGWGDARLGTDRSQVRIAGSLLVCREANWQLLARRGLGVGQHGDHCRLTGPS